MENNKVYIDTDVLRNFEENIKALNIEAIGILTDIDSELDNMENVWEGTAADSFVNLAKRHVSDAKKYQNGFQNFKDEISIIVEKVSER